jgi:hypothetical protein
VNLTCHHSPAGAEYAAPAYIPRHPALRRNLLAPKDVYRHVPNRGR